MLTLEFSFLMRLQQNPMTGRGSHVMSSGLFRWKTMEWLKSYRTEWSEWSVLASKQSMLLFFFNKPQRYRIWPITESQYNIDCNVQKTIIRTHTNISSSCMNSWIRNMLVRVSFQHLGRISFSGYFINCSAQWERNFGEGTGSPCYLI